MYVDEDKCCVSSPHGGAVSAPAPLTNLFQTGTFSGWRRGSALLYRCKSDYVSLTRNKQTPCYIIHAFIGFLKAVEYLGGGIKHLKTDPKWYGVILSLV